jgi:hypothetical protein
MKKHNHYVFLNPGEKLYVMSDMVAGDAHDYATVIEVEFPTEKIGDELFHKPPADGKLQAYRVARLELNEQANLTSEGEPLDHAYARYNEKRRNAGIEPWVSVPIQLSTKEREQEEAATLVKAFGAEVAQ